MSEARDDLSLVCKRQCSYIKELEADITCLSFTNNLLIKKYDQIELEKAELVNALQELYDASIDCIGYELNVFISKLLQKYTGGQENERT